MNVDAARSSSVVSSDSETSSSSGESLDEFHRNIFQGGEALGYQFEPTRDSNNGSGESADIEDDQNMSSDEDESVIVYIDKLYFVFVNCVIPSKINYYYEVFMRTLPDNG